MKCLQNYGFATIQPIDFRMDNPQLSNMLKQCANCNKARRVRSFERNGEGFQQRFPQASGKR
jgi:hypothetical protein